MAGDPDVLVVDDETVILEAAKRILEDQDLRVDVARDAEAALELVERQRYRAVLCDLVLPRINGFELVVKIRDRLPGVPVVLITGYATLENAASGFSQGVFDFIPKPFDYAELSGVVQRALGYEERARSAGGGSATGVAEFYTLGDHAWVMPDADGSVRAGMGATFASLSGQFDSLVLPSAGNLVSQGNQCARWMTGEAQLHRLWSPVSGRIVETNSAAFADPALRGPEAAGEGWVVHLIPSMLAQELEKLMRRWED